MITVQVQRRMQGQTMAVTVQLSNCSRLTPESARDALEVAFGGRSGGLVWWSIPGQHGLGYGFRLYPKSYKKIHHF